MAEENECLRFEIQRLKKEFRYEQGKERAANLIVRNCFTNDDLEETLRNRVLEIFKDAKIKINCEDITAAGREGRPNQDASKVRPIKISLSEPRLKNVIFPVAKLIRIKHGVSIDNDYSPLQREELFNLRTTRRSLKEMGINCPIKGFNILIHNKAFDWQAALRYARNSQRTSQSQESQASQLPPPADDKEEGSCNHAT